MKLFFEFNNRQFGDYDIILHIERPNEEHCKKCGKPLIIRDGYNILEYHIENSLCKYCKTEVDGIF